VNIIDKNITLYIGIEIQIFNFSFIYLKRWNFIC